MHLNGDVVEDLGFPNHPFSTFCVDFHISIAR